MKETPPRDCLTLTLAATFVTFALMSFLVALLIPPLAGARIAREGEWVMNPDGSRVCRVMRDLHYGDPISPLHWCKDWQEPPPHEYQSLKAAWSRLDGNRWQFFIEGKWVP